MCMYHCKCPQNSEKAVEFPKAEITEDYESFNKGAENQTWVLCKGNMQSKALSCLSSPYFWYFKLSHQTLNVHFLNVRNQVILVTT